MLAFVHIEKTAGIAIRWVLRSSFGLRHCDVEPWKPQRSPEPFSPEALALRPVFFSPEDMSLLMRYFPYLKSIAGHKLVPYAGLEKICSDIQYITFLRNPLSRTASYYQYLLYSHGQKHHAPFETWIQGDYSRNMQTKRLSGKEDVNAAIRAIQEKNIFVGLVEQFDESILLLKELVYPSLNINYERMNVASNNQLARELLESERTVQMLREANKEDLQLYEYVQKELYPRQKRTYGHSLQEDLAHYQSVQHRFNRRKVIINRVQRNLIYKPMLYLYRRGKKN